MAQAAGCSEQTIRDIDRNFRRFGHVYAFPNPCLSVTKHNTTDARSGLRLSAEKARSVPRGDGYLVWDEFQMQATNSNIRKALVSQAGPKRPLDSVLDSVLKSGVLKLLGVHLHDISGN
jgi:hypothetical protein